MPDTARSQRFEVGAWTVEPHLNQISRNGEVRRLEPKVMAVLETLATRPGEVVSRDDLLLAAWADVVVTENGVARAVASLRKLLEDDWRRPAYIQTVSKAGYRLVAGVRPLAAEERVEEPTAPEARRGRERPVGQRRFLAAVAVLGVVAVLVLAAWGGAPTLPERGWTVPLSIPVTTLPGREMYPAISPDGTRVAFVRPAQSEGDLYARTGWNIFVKKIGSEDVVQLTHEPEYDAGPTWSPDGERIAWYRTSKDDCAFYVTSASGGTHYRVASCEYRVMGRLSWNPDGSWLASSEAMSADAPRQVVLTEVATGKRRLLTTPPNEARGDQYPVFSPDGTRVAFTRAFPDGRGDLYVVPAAGGEPRRLSSRHRIVMGLDWSADGSRLVYSASYGGIPALWSLPAAGGEPSPVRVSDYLAYWPSLSRADDRIVYSRYDDDTNIYAVDLGAGEEGVAPESWLAAGSTRQEYQPQLSPDGQRLAFVSNRSGSFEIYTSQLDGTGVRQNTELQGPMVAMPSWSPDGRSLVFQAHGEAGAHLYRVEAEGRRPRRLTRGSAGGLNASWSRDGEWIYFASDRSDDWQIWKMRPDGEGAWQITQHGGFRGMEDPTGESLIFFKHDEKGIWQLPLDGGPERLLLGEVILSEFGHWTVAEDGIWFVRRGPDSGLAFYDFETGTSTVRYKPDKPIPHTPNTLTVTPDGKTVLFVQVERSESDIVLLERSAWAS